MVDRPPIGQVIRAKRKELGHTQAEFALLCGITPQYLSLLELGDVNVSLDTLLMICEVLGKPLSKLMEAAEHLAIGVGADSPATRSSASKPAKLPEETRPAVPRGRKTVAGALRSAARQTATKTTTAAKKSPKPAAGKSSGSATSQKSAKAKQAPIRKR
ncbi:helix-turn-helix domain-containing protein [Paraburkholderia caribensis]|uniref:helix-turn-helix domain-containing protein n=1 Tax=Paraburkholderia caribensis TaxID=75105 RepID=UPI0015924D11|nr:helix-turn-helix transcriptional regulator [Paraburkholderia caribensis]